MNAKLCKTLRNVARERTISMPARQLVTDRRNASTLVNVLRSTRGVYRALKKANS